MDEPSPPPYVVATSWRHLVGMRVVIAAASVCTSAVILLCYVRDWRFSLLVALLLAMPTGSKLAEYHRPVRSASALAHGLEFAGWRRRIVVPWARITAVCLRRDASRWARRVPLVSMFFHVNLEVETVGYSLSRVSIAEAEALVRLIAARSADQRSQVVLGPFVSLWDRSTWNVAAGHLVWMTAVGASLIPMFGLPWKAVFSICFLASCSALVAAMLRSTLRRRVVVWDGTNWSTKIPDRGRDGSPYREAPRSEAQAVVPFLPPPWPLVPWSARLFAQEVACRFKPPQISLTEKYPHADTKLGSRDDPASNSTQNDPPQH